MLKKLVDSMHSKAYFISLFLFLNSFHNYSLCSEEDFLCIGEKSFPYLSDELTLNKNTKMHNSLSQLQNESVDIQRTLIAFVTNYNQNHPNEIPLTTDHLIICPIRSEEIAVSVKEENSTDRSESRQLNKSTLKLLQTHNIYLLQEQVKRLSNQVKTLEESEQKINHTIAAFYSQLVTMTEYINSINKVFLCSNCQNPKMSHKSLCSICAFVSHYPITHEEK